VVVLLLLCSSGISCKGCILSEAAERGEPTYPSTICASRSPAGHAVLGTRWDRDGNTLRRGPYNREGSDFRKPCTSCLVERVVICWRIARDI